MKMLCWLGHVYFGGCGADNKYRVKYIISSISRQAPIDFFVRRNVFYVRPLITSGGGGSGLVAAGKTVLEYN